MTLSGRNRYIFIQFAYEIAYWVFILLVYVVLRYGGSYLSHPEVVVFYDKLSTTDLVLYTVAGGVFLGGLLATLRLFLYRKMCKKYSVGRSILWQTFANLMVFTFLVIIYILLHSFRLGYTIYDVQYFLTDFYSLPALVILLGFFTYASLQFSLLLEADKKLGMNVLANLLLGKYHYPKQENRIFMFLDMKDSTKTAEALGHLKYSRYLQNIFKLLTEIVIDSKAEIYQFVGDEVVLTWKSEIGYRNNNALHLFYGFQKLLEANKAYFNNNYGVTPVFKAGIHRGEVSVAEVGEINTQIAFHGDVVNTTSRIQELCNVYNTNLLVSEKFMKGMKIRPTNYKENAAEISLRGRKQPVKIYTFETANTK